MSWYKVIVIVLFLLQVSNCFNFSKTFEQIATPIQFANTIQNYITGNGNQISKQCAMDLLQYRKALLNGEMWAWLMLDAGSKIPAGILSGNLVGLGNFDQCLNIKATISEKDIYGKYCMGGIPFSLPSGEDFKSINKIFNAVGTPQTRMLNSHGSYSAMFSTCVPDSCSTSDLQKIYSWVGINTSFHEVLCQSKVSQPDLTGGDIATITFLSVILCIMLVCTIYDVYLFYLNKKPAHFVLIAFSILTNGRKLITISKTTNQISCLHGIRVISMMWIVLSHKYTYSMMFPNRNAFDLLNWVFDAKNMFIMGATVSVDTFFVLSGLLVSYCFMNAVTKGLKFNIIVFYIHRYLRLTPLLAVIILIYVTILNHLGSGPLWKMAMVMLRPACQQNWWSALLYVQNYVNQENTCIGQSWYLSVDTQLFLLSPIILIPLKKMPRVGIIIAAVGTLLSILASFLLAWFYEIRGLLLANEDDSFNKHYYFATHTRAGPWFMGIILGYYIYKIQNDHRKILLNKLLAVLLWVISLLILCSCVFAGHNTLTEPYDRLGNSFYVSLLRPGWSLALCWVIFACSIGYGGPVNWLLSLPVFQIVSKLTYSMYLIHLGLQGIIVGQMRSTSVFSTFQMFYTFWGDFMFTMAIAFIFTLAFESPIIIIEKWIFGNKTEKKTEQSQKNEPIQNVP